MRSILMVIAALAICASSAFGQSVSDIESKYGKAVKAGNVYSLSEHVWMAPAYDAEGQVCLMRLYPKPISPNTTYLADRLVMDEVLKVIDELIPVSTRGARKAPFGVTATGGGDAWTYYIYDRVTFTFIGSFRFAKTPERGFGEAFDLDVDEKPLAEVRHKEVIQSDNELMRQHTASPEVLVIRWSNRKCGRP